MEETPHTKPTPISSDKTPPKHRFGLNITSLSSAKRPLATLKRKLNRSVIVPFICLLLGIAGGLLGSALYNIDSPTPASTSLQYVSDEGRLITSIAQKTGPGVVSVETTSIITTQDLFGFSRRSSQQSAGTGFIISSSGIIVTNRHVVPAGTSTVSVTLADGTRYANVKVIGRTSPDDPLDVAFLKLTSLKGKVLTPVTLGDSSKMQVGDRVVAIGNALGQFQNTVTSGIISGYGRDVTAGNQSGTISEKLNDLFQTDAAINEGNSGGPLVNMNNEVIALNTAIASGAQNIGFAIPINNIKGLVSSVFKNGRLITPYLGVYYVSITNDLAYQYGLSVKKGAYILPQSQTGQSPTVAGSPADKAGLRGGDIITRVNDIPVDQKTSLSGVLVQFSVGETVKLTVIRGGKTIVVDVKLAASPPNQ